MRSLTECHSWDEALNVQSEYTRTSLDRVCSRAVKSAEVTAEMFSRPALFHSKAVLAEPQSACPGGRHSRSLEVVGSPPHREAPSLGQLSPQRAICSGAVQTKTSADERTSRNIASGGLSLMKRPDR
jgi:hypothetical protein